MQRDADKAEKLQDTKRVAAGLPIGTEGEFYVGGGILGSVLDNNEPPITQPGLWCSWEFFATGQHLFPCDGKNYAYGEWLLYLCHNFLKPWGYELTGGPIYITGEDIDDRGELHVRLNAESGDYEVDHVDYEIVVRKAFTGVGWVKEQVEPQKAVVLDWDGLEYMFKATEITP